MKIHTVIFDLDGTLIDSAPSILSSMRVAFDDIGIKPTEPLTHHLIGPPLRDIFINLLNEENKDKLPQLIEGFKLYYDESGHKETRVYESINEMLDELLKMKLKLYIATNKRILPTLKILDCLSWRERFHGIYALDCFEPILRSKMEMLQRLYIDLPNANNGAIYIGDRTEDAEAAKQAGLPFLYADWGYGNNNLICRDFFRIVHPSMLLSELRRIS